MKTTRIIALVLVMVMAMSLFAGCQQETQTGTRHEVSNYQGQLQEGQTKADFNEALFYRNDKKTNGPDPFVLDNTSRDGYYYIYGTESSSLFTYRSKNLMDWEPVGNCLNNMDYAANGGRTEFRNVTDSSVWAPEMVYDPDTELYYLFFSATPKAAGLKEGEGVGAGDGYELMFVATSKYPDRDFELVNFKDPASCGEENLHTYNDKTGVKNANGEYEMAWPHYYAKYLLFDPAQYRDFAEANGGFRGVGHGNFEGGIDPHPYIDEDGTKYLVWVDSTGSDRLSMVKMDNWLKPDWSTATVITYHGYYTVADWKAATEGVAVEMVSYEPTNVTINEGAVIIKHNGLYYLTFSVGSYKDSSYQVAQAVSENVMGPYRKLTEAEGGILISGGTQGSQEVSGTGHHSFAFVGGEQYIIYHRHDDFIKAGGARNPAIDEVKWITVKDINGNDLEVMYVNGPTISPQPRIEAFAEYVNIADQAAVSGTEDAAFLTDGLLSTYKYANEEFISRIGETTITEKTTFTFDFDAARPVRAVMVYNSKFEFTAFMKVSMEFVCEENGAEVIRCINDVAFSSEYFTANDYDGSIYYITPGAAAYAEFNELNVKSVRITVEVPEGQESVGISEVRILGK